MILAEETEDEAQGGGAGKGIFFKAIGKLINLVSIDGKNFKLDKSFAFPNPVAAGEPHRAAQARSSIPPPLQWRWPPSPRAVPDPVQDPK